MKKESGKEMGIKRESIPTTSHILSTFVGSLSNVSNSRSPALLSKCR